MLRGVWSKFILALSIVVVLVPNLMALGVASAATEFADSEYSDLKGHWSQEVFTKWVNEGWIKGYPDGTYKPDKVVKRAEFAAMINRAFGLTASSDELPFSDMTKQHWAFQDVVIAYQAGYFKGANGEAAPDRQSTRQEGAVMIAGLLGVDDNAVADLSKYKDGEATASWAKVALSELSVKGIFKGDTNGNIRPAAALTRAQAITVIDAALNEKREQIVFDEPGEYGSEDELTVIQGDVVVEAAGITLVNTDIQGDLLLAEGIAEGDVYLKQVNVRGTTTVQGGGENSIHVEDSVLVKVIVDKATGKVRIVATGSTEVKTVVVQSPVKLEELATQDGGKGFNTVELAKSLPANSTIDLVGQFEDVRVLATTIQVNIPSGAIARLEVAANSKNNKIELGEEASIIDLVLNAIAELAGKGKIVTATLGEQAEGTKFETEPEKVAGPGQSGGETTPPVIIPGGGGGGPIVQPPAGDQTSASLSAIQLGGNYTLVQRDAELAPVGTGFKKDILGYSVSVPRNITNTIVPVTVTSESSAASIDAIVAYKDQSGSNYSLTTQNQTINVQLKPLEDVQVYITVTSGNGQITKNYMISFQFERTVQDAFLIKQSSFSHLIGPGNVRYYLYSHNVLNKGDVVELYESSVATEPFHSAVAGTSGNIDLFFKDENYELQEAGEFIIKVKRNGSIILDGAFQYDLADMQKITGVNGISVYPLTREEREEKAGTPSPEEPYFIAMAFDPSQWTGTILESAKYYTSYGASSDAIYFEAGVPAIGSFKADIDPYYTSVNLIDQREYYYGVYNFMDPVVSDSYVQIIFYDEEYRPIGYFEQAVEPGEEHVLPTYTVMHSINPELNSGDESPPIITSALPTYVGLGDQLSIGVNERANVYIVPASSEWATGREIHDLVRGGEGVGVHYRVTDSLALLDTNKLTVGEWMVVAVDASGNISSSVTVAIVNAEDALIFDGFLYRFNNGIGLRFDNEINVTGNLKQAIFLSRDGGLTYEPLGANDRASLDSDSSIFIDFERPYSGSLNHIKIVGGSLVKGSGEALAYDWISPAFSAGTDVIMTSGDELEVGDEVVFSVDRPSTMYLIPSEWLIRPEQAVTEGKGKSIEVSEGQVGEEVRISTQGLAPGRYLLYTTRGVTHYIDLGITDRLNSSQITVTNSQVEKSVTVTALNEGDTIRVFAFDPSTNTKSLLHSKTVLPGETSVKLEGLELNENGGMVMITIQAANRGESDGLVINYS